MDETALGARMENVGDILAKLPTCTTLTALNVLGDVSDAMKAALAPMNPTFFTPVATTVTA